MGTRARTPAGRRQAARSAAKRAPRRKAHGRAPQRQAPARSKRPESSGKDTSRRRRATLWLAVLAIGAGGLAAGYFGWLRDSSLVAVTDVEVSGLRSSDGKRIEAALVRAAKPMSTLNLDHERLRAAVKPFPTVAAIEADPSPPHGLAIEVTERRPALIVTAGGGSLPAAGDGTLLPGLKVGKQAQDLPTLSVPDLPDGGSLEGDALEQATVAGAAPASLRPLIEGLSFSRRRGVEITLRGGVPVRFGSAEQAHAKWAAAAAVLADPKLDTLTYVDVRVPERPAVGGAAAPTAQEAPADPAAEAALAEPLAEDVAVEPVTDGVAVEPAAEPGL